MELSPAQKAALRSVLQNKSESIEQMLSDEPERLEVRPQNMPHPDRAGKTRKADQQPPQKAAQNIKKQKTKKRKRADIHAYSDKQLKKKGSPVKAVILTLLLIIVLAGGGFYAWYYWWTEYATFDYELQPIVILSGQSVEASDFISPSKEMEQVTAAFQSPSFKPQDGLQHVPLTLTLGLRSLETSTTLHVMTAINQISHEFRETAPELRAIDFVANLDASAGVYFDVVFVETPMLLEEYDVGDHTLSLSLNGAPFNVLLTVVDTTPPYAKAVSKTITAGETVNPEDFVDEVFDHSGIMSIEFVQEPNILSDRDQIVEVEITDNEGNSAIFAGELTVILNEAPPVIEGTDTILSTMGEPIIYSRGVTAHDDMGRELEVQVDSSDVDFHNVGIYTVIYFAVDATGLRTEIEETVHILDIDFEFVNERVDAALDSIFRDNMTQLDKVKAIYRWVKNNIVYSPVRGGPETAYEGAYRALRTRSGNCFSYYSLSEIMLTRAGIPNMRIDRIPGTATRHRWNLVNPDELGWHHFDTTPIRLDVSTDFFTDSRAREITRRYERHDGTKDYFTYDPTLYPVEIVE